MHGACSLTPHPAANEMPAGPNENDISATTNCVRTITRNYILCTCMHKYMYDVLTSNHAKVPLMRDIVQEDSTVNSPPVMRYSSAYANRISISDKNVASSFSIMSIRKIRNITRTISVLKKKILSILYNNL